MKFYAIRIDSMVESRQPDQEEIARYQRLIDEELASAGITDVVVEITDEKYDDLPQREQLDEDLADALERAWERFINNE
jgi:hypothetical protein